MPATIPLTEVEFHITEASTLAEIDEAIAHCVASARRTPIKDTLSRPNPDHQRVHEYLDALCELRLTVERNG